MPDDAEYDPACIRALATLGPSKRDPADPILRWVDDFLGIPPADRVALRAEDISYREMALIMASQPDGPGYSLDDIPDEPSDRHPVEDGPGSGVRVELTVRVLVGLERSTVIVADPITGRALSSEVVPHGSEPGAAAAAVEAIVGKRLPR